MEGVTGKQYVYSRPLPEEEVHGWYADQQATKARIDEKRIKREVQKEVVVNRKDALEQVELTTRVAVDAQEISYDLDPASGNIVAVSKTVKKMQNVASGQTGYKLKAGIRMDKKTGTLYRRKTREEAEQDFQPYAIPDPPAGMQSRLAVQAQQ